MCLPSLFDQKENQKNKIQQKIIIFNIQLEHIKTCFPFYTTRPLNFVALILFHLVADTLVASQTFLRVFPCCVDLLVYSEIARVDTDSRKTRINECDCSIYSLNTHFASFSGVMRMNHWATGAHFTNVWYDLHNFIGRSTLSAQNFAKHIHHVRIEIIPKSTESHWISHWPTHQEFSRLIAI